MPFTPFHLGPGLVFKAIGGRHFSFMVFGGAQVLIDIEPGLGLVLGWPVLHGWTHTFAGAAAIGAVAAVIGRPVSVAVLRDSQFQIIRHAGVRDATAAGEDIDPVLAHTPLSLLSALDAAPKPRT